MPGIAPIEDAADPAEPDDEGELESPPRDTAEPDEEGFDEDGLEPPRGAAEPTVSPLLVREPACGGPACLSWAQTGARVSAKAAVAAMVNLWRVMSISCGKPRARNP